MKPRRSLVLALLGLAGCGTLVDGDPQVASGSFAVESDCVADHALPSMVPVTAFGNTTSAGNEWASKTCYTDGSSAYPEVAYSWTAPSADTFEFDTFGSQGFAPILYIRKVTDDGLSCGEELACAMAWQGTTVQIPLASGDQVIVVVDGYYGSGPFRLHIGLPPACGDGICSPAEDATTCPCDCSCGDGVPQYGPVNPNDPRYAPCPTKFFNETCDDGNHVDGDGCTSSCAIEKCGDCILQPGEECDDCNGNDLDDCSNSCKVQYCGDLKLETGWPLLEECDDGNQDDLDGCSASCKLESCGDGKVDPLEQCDDGNRTDNDGCNHICRNECGNGIVQAGAGEQCDDGNTVANDGCSAKCKLEPTGGEPAIGTALLFPFVANRAGYDTGIAISNTQSGLVPPGQPGICTLLYFMQDGSSSAPQVLNVAPGHTVTFGLSGIAPGTGGYLIALCSFRFAEGVAVLTDIGAGRVMSSYVAQKLPLSGRPEVRTLGFPLVSSGPTSSDLTEVAISNTSHDTLGTPAHSVHCKLYSEGSNAVAFEAVIAPGAQALTALPSDGQQEAARAECYAIDASGNETDGKVFVAGFAWIVSPLFVRETAYLAESNPLPKTGTSRWFFSNPQGGQRTFTMSAPHGTPGGSCSFQAFPLTEAGPLPVQVAINARGVASYTPPVQSSYTIATCNFAAASGTAMSTGGTAAGGTLSSYDAEQLFTPEADTHVLLFPYATTFVGFVTEFDITNASSTDGTCTIKYYGQSFISPQSPDYLATRPLTVNAGQTVSFQASETFGSALIAGYMIADCSFKAAHGLAFMRRLDNSGGFVSETAYNGLSRIPPVARCKDATANADPEQCDATVSIDDGSSDPDHPGQPLSFAQDPNAPYAIGVSQVSLTATDADSLSDSCEATVTVLDGTGPSMTCPADVEKECDAVGKATGVSAGAATVSDCSTFTVNEPGIADYPLGTTTITHSATDAAGNSSECPNHVAVADTTPPVIICPANISVECDGMDQISELNAGTASVSDVCTSTSDIIVSEPGSQSYDLGKTSVAHSATDGVGLVSSCSNVVTVVDTIKPSIICPADVTAECEGMSQALVSAGKALASDICSINIAIGEPGSQSYPVGTTTTVTHSATDDAGNKSECDNTVTVEDTIKPTIICPAVVTVECSGPDKATDVSAGTATASDICGDVSVSDPAPTDYKLGTTPATHTATDGVGLVSTCTNDVIVVDTKAPVFDQASLGPRTIAGSCSATELASFPLPTATDVCGVVTVTCDPLLASNFGTHIVTCTASDGHKNSISADLRVTIEQPLHLVFEPPLADDNVADDPYTDTDTDGLPQQNLFNTGSTVPHKLRLYDCSGANVTSSVPVKVTLAVRRGADGSSGFVDGGDMKIVTGQYQFNLVTTKPYPVGQIFQSLVTVVYAAAPSVVVGVEDARLKSN